jgi:hypothetical protein
VRRQVKASLAGSIEGFGRLLCLGVLLMAAFTGLLGAASAQADPAVRTYKSTGSGPPVPSGVSRVAVESDTGNLLVLTTGGTILVLAPDGTQLTTISVPGTPAGVATDPGTGAVYYAEASGSITRYTSDGAPTPTYTVDGTFSTPPIGSGSGEIAAIADLAVDPSTHDILAVDPSNDRVSRLSSAGGYLGDFAGSSAPSEGFAGARDIDVGPSGEILVLASGHIDRFSSAGAPEGELLFQGPDPAAAIAIDSTSGAVLVVASGSPGGFFSKPDLYSYENSSVTTPAVVKFNAPLAEFLGARPGALAVDSAGNRAYATYDGTFSSTPGMEAFDAAVRPGVSSPEATQIVPDGMHLHATIDSGENGALPPEVVQGTAHFVLTSPVAPTVETPAQDYAPTVGDQDINSDVTGLVPNTPYSIRLVAESASTVASGPLPQSLTAESTPATVTTGLSAPAVETGAATDITGSSTVLHGSVAAYGLQTTYYFEYGPTAAYGFKVPNGAPGVAGISYTPRPVQRTIDDLQPGVTYHYRLVATNSVGTTVGDDKTFTTTAGGSTARVFEMVTPPEKAGGEVNGNFAFQAAPDGETMSYAAVSGFGGVEAASGSRESMYMSRRSAAGWGLPEPLDPPIDTHRGLLAAGLLTLGISDDSSHAFVVSNKKLTSDALSVEAAGGADLYVRDLNTGNYTFVAGSTVEGAFAIYASVANDSKYIGGTTDFSAVVFDAAVPMTPDALPRPMRGVYRWSEEDGLELVSKLPDGSAAPGVVRRPGGEVLKSVSGDGSRVVFTLNQVVNGEGGAPTDGVYLWEAGQTRAISVSHRSGDPETVQPGSAAGISQDGRYVVFAVNSPAPLTDDAPEAAGNIYRLDLSEGGDGALTWIPMQPGSTVTTLSDDGSHIYLGGTHEAGEEGGLFAWSSAGLQRFAPAPSKMSTRLASPNGRYFAFMSFDQLTPDAVPGQATIYFYDSVRAEFSCASCPEDGSAPIAPGLFPEAEVAQSNRYPQTILDRGEVFFTTATPLVAADVNDRTDVYSFRDGQARLISPGTGPYNARFADAGANGRDVFILTEEPLSVRDKDSSFDLYDAREGGSETVPETDAPCGGDSCEEKPTAVPGPLAAATQSTVGRPVKPRRHKHHKKHRRKHHKPKHRENARLHGHGK